MAVDTVELMGLREQDPRFPYNDLRNHPNLRRHVKAFVLHNWRAFRSQQCILLVYFAMFFLMINASVGALVWGGAETLTQEPLFGSTYRAYHPAAFSDQCRYAYSSASWLGTAGDVHLEPTRAGLNKYCFTSHGDVIPVFHFSNNASMLVNYSSFLNSQSRQRYAVGLYKEKNELTVFSDASTAGAIASTIAYTACRGATPNLPTTMGADFVVRKDDYTPPNRVGVDKEPTANMLFMIPFLFLAMSSTLFHPFAGTDVATAACTTVVGDLVYVALSGLQLLVALLAATLFTTLSALKIFELFLLLAVLFILNRVCNGCPWHWWALHFMGSILCFGVVMLPDAAQAVLALAVPSVMWGISIMQIFASTEEHYARTSPFLSSGGCLGLFIAQTVLLFAFRIGLHFRRLAKCQVALDTEKQPFKGTPTKDDDCEMRSTSSFGDNNARQVRSTPATTVHIRGLSKTFKDTTALNRFNLDVFEGEILVVLGHNGAGKSTLLNLLTGSGTLDDSSASSFCMFGHSLSLDVKESDTYGRLMCHFVKEGYLVSASQSSHLNAFSTNLTIRENLQFIAAFSPAEDPELATSQIMTKLNLKDESCSNLSGGKAQLVATACKLLRDANMLILDEPSSAMDPASRQLVWSALLDERRRGKTIILSTHLMEEAEHLADRILVMSHGKDYCCETPQVLKQRYGVGYHLTFVKQYSTSAPGARTEDREPEQLDSTCIFNPHVVASLFALHGVIEDATLLAATRESTQDCTYLLPISALDQFGDLLADIEDKLATEIGAASYGLSMNSLEDAFVEIVKSELEKHQDDDDDKNSDDDTDELLQALPDGSSIEALFEAAAAEAGTNSWWLHQLGQHLRREWGAPCRYFIAGILVVVLGLFPLIMIDAIVASERDYSSSSPPPTPAPTVAAATPAPETAAPTTPPPAVPDTVKVELVDMHAPYCARRVKPPPISRHNTDKLLTLWKASFDEATALSPKELTFVYTAEKPPSAFVERFGFDLAPPHYRPEIAAQFHFDPCSMAEVFDPKVKNMTYRPIYGVTLGPAGRTTSDGASVAYTELLTLLDISLRAAIDNLILIENNHSATTQPVSLPAIRPVQFPQQVEEEAIEAKRRPFYALSSGYDDDDAVRGLSFWGFMLGMDYIMLSMVVTFFSNLLSPPDLLNIQGVAASTMVGAKLVELLACTGGIVTAYCIYVSHGTMTQALAQHGGLVTLNALSLISCFLHPTLLVSAISFLLPRHLQSTTALWVILILIVSIMCAMLPWGLGHSTVSPAFSPFCGIMFMLVESTPSFSGACLGFSLLWHAVCAIPIVISMRKPFAPHDDVRTISANDRPLTDANDDVANETAFVDSEENAAKCVVAPCHVSKRFVKGTNILGKETETPSILESMCTGTWKTVVDDLTFGVRRGEVFGLLGPNGAGKSTTISMILKEYAPDAGYVLYPSTQDGIRSALTDSASTFVPSQRWGWCQQKDQLGYDTAQEILHKFLFYRLGRHYKNKERWDPYVEHVIRKLKLHYKESKDKKFHEMSGGMKRRVCVAVALFTGALTAFLDEPSAAVDPFLRRSVWKSINDFMALDRDAGTTASPQRSVLLTTHSMEEADAVCARIGIMTEGSMKCIGNSQHLKNKYSGGYAITITLPESDGSGSEQRPLHVVSTPAQQRSIAECIADGSLPQDSQRLGTEHVTSATQLGKAICTAMGPSCRFTEAASRQLRFTIDDVPSLAAVFKELKALKASPSTPAMEAYCVSQVTSLQDIFVAIAGTSVMSADGTSAFDQAVTGVPVKTV